MIVPVLVKRHRRMSVKSTSNNNICIQMYALYMFNCYINPTFIFVSRYCWWGLQFVLPVGKVTPGKMYANISLYILRAGSLWHLRWYIIAEKNVSRHKLCSVTEQLCGCYTGKKIKAGCHTSEIILGMGSANEKCYYHVMPPFIGWAHVQNDPGT